MFGVKQVPVIPAPEKPDEHVGHAIEIRADRDSFHVLCDSLQMRYGDLARVDSVLSKLIGSTIDSSVVITWTDATTYGTVIEIIDVLKKNGIRNYCMAKAE